VDASINRTWSERRQTIAYAIAILQPDVLLLQEDFYSMNDELLHQMPVPSLNGSTALLSNTYQRCGLFNRNGESQPSETWPENVFTGDGVRDGEHNSVWWSQRWKLVNKSAFWLSHTPDVPGTSFGELTGRIANCAVLQDRQKEKRQMKRPAYYKFCSTHMPSGNITRQLLSAEVISSNFETNKGEYSYSFIGGDFNTYPGSSVYSAMEGHGFHDIAASSMPNYNEAVSTSDWYKKAETNQVIDFLWLHNNGGYIQSKTSAFVIAPCCDMGYAKLKRFIEKQIQDKGLSLTNKMRPAASDHLALVVDILLL